MDYWIKARYAGKCAECECDISEGDRIVYSPSESGRASVYCAVCGEDVISEDEIEVD